MIVNAETGRIAVFFDRDGTLNQEVGYLSRPEQVELLPGTVEALKILNIKGIAAIVVTNQSGVARGLFPEERIHEIHHVLQEKLRDEGAWIDRFYYCPHHPAYGSERYRQDCACRKPKIGMLQQAARDLDLELSSCYLIGDSMSDLEAARNAGMKAVLVLTGYGPETYDRVESGVSDAVPHLVAPDIVTAVQWVITDNKSNENSHH